MIRFLRNYETESVPPEKFEAGSEHSRSEASELYLVSLGVAAYLVDGKLLDQDYRPVSETLVSAEVVSPSEGRSVAGVRGGELLTDTPQRASSGPRAAIVITGGSVGPVPGTPGVVLEAENERLRTELAALQAGGTVDGLRLELAGANNELTALRETIRLTDSDRTAVTGERDELLDRVAELGEQLRANQEERDALAARVTELEAQQAEAANPPSGDGPGGETPSLLSAEVGAEAQAGEAEPSARTAGRKAK